MIELSALAEALLRLYAATPEEIAAAELELLAAGFITPDSTN